MELQQCNGTRSENLPAFMAQSLYAGHLFDEDLQARWVPIACSQQPEYSQPPHGGHAAGAELSNRTEYNQFDAGFFVASGAFKEYGSSQVVHDPIATAPAELRLQLSVELESNNLDTAATQPGHRSLRNRDSFHTRESLAERARVRMVEGTTVTVSPTESDRISTYEISSTTEDQRTHEVHVSRFCQCEARHDDTILDQIGVLLRQMDGLKQQNVALGSEVAKLKDVVSDLLGAHQYQPAGLVGSTDTPLGKRRKRASMACELCRRRKARCDHTKIVCKTP